VQYQLRSNFLSFVCASLETEQLVNVLKADNQYDM